MEKSVLKQPSLATVSILGQPPGQADAIKYHFKAGSLFSSTAIFSLFFLALFFSTSSLADTGKDAINWVQKMSSSMQDLSYKGHFIYLHNNQLESMSVLHVNDAMGQRERLVSLNGEAREILRDNSTLTCIWPSSRQVVVDQSNPKGVSPLRIPENVERLAKYYRFSFLGRDRIADQPAVIVSIKPLDPYRYGMKIWIQEHNGLLLQSSFQDEQDQPMEQVMFTEMTLLGKDEIKTLSVLPEIDSGFALIRSHDGKDYSRLPADTQWHSKQIPEGFELQSAFQRKMMNSDNLTQQMVFSDGMASVSVFIEKASKKGLSGESSMGAVNAFSTKYRDYTITAIGEVPAITVKTISQSITRLN